jgi:hypothetical protein
MSTLYHDSSNWPMLRMFVVSRGMKYTPKEQPPLAILAGERHCALPFNSRLRIITEMDDVLHRHVVGGSCVEDPCCRHKVLLYA